MKHTQYSLLIVTALLITILTSCAIDKENTLANTQLAFSFTLTDSIQFVLDEKTVVSSEESFQYFEENGYEYFAKFNRPDESIKIFSVKDQNTFKTINLKKQGPEAVIDLNGVANSFKIISLDSILIASKVKKQIHLINPEGKRSLTLTYKDIQSDKNYPIFLMDAGSRMIWRNGIVIIPGAISWENHSFPPVASLSKNSEQKQIPSDFPLYSQHALNKVGDISFLRGYSTVNDEQNILISYPLDHRILILGKDLVPTYKDLTNPRIGKLRTYDKDMRTVDIIASDDFYEFRETTGKYQFMLFDKFRQVYYRVARLPLDVKSFRNAISEGKKIGFDYSIMAYDLNFNPVGELLFNTQTIDNTILNPYMMFVSEQGFQINKWMQNDENILKFVTFQLQLK